MKHIALPIARSIGLTAAVAALWPGLALARAPVASFGSAASGASAPALAAPVQTERFVLKPGQTVIGRVQIVRLKPHQVLSDLARRFDVGNDAILRANPGVDPWLAAPGTRVLVPTQFILPRAPHVGIVVNLAAMRLFYYPPHAPGEPQLVITHPVGIGRLGWPTPTGLTRVVGHVAHPAWFVPRSILAEHAKEGVPLPKVVPAGPDNPLGNWALPLAWPGYLIHGTDKPAGVGRRVSHGCIHLYPEDIRQLYRRVPNGTPVRVVNQPYLFGWRDGRLYLQAYGPLKDDKRPWKSNPTLLGRMLTPALIADLERSHQKIDWKRVSAELATPAIVPWPVSGSGPAAPRAVLVENRLPQGSAWNGRTHLPLTPAQFDAIMAHLASARSARAAEPPGSPRRAPSGTR